MSRRHTPTPSDRRDRGSILPLVLVFLVIGSLVVIPMLTYASTVLRANGVAVQKTETMEQLRGAARVAAGDPADLFVRCSGNTPVNLPIASSLVPGTSSTCRRLSQVAVLDELQVPYGAAAMQVGQTVPAGVSHTTAQPPVGATAAWYGNPADTSCAGTQRWCPDPRQDTIWMPVLPEAASSQQQATGHPMPAPRDCTVYFPGTYTAALVLDRPAYFVSGVYHFRQNVTVVGGADVVFGSGLAEGCVGGDSDAVLDMHPNPLPANLNAEGNGATLIFSDEARLIIDDTLTTSDRTTRAIVANTSNRRLRFEINQRYVKDVSDAAARVSILSVNGDRDVNTSVTPNTVWIGALDVPGVISVRESVVKTSAGSLVTASSRGINPSSLTAEPRVPEAPRNVQVRRLRDDLRGSGFGAAQVSWSAPVGNDEGGSTITRYVVTEVNNPSFTCSTDGATSCVVRGIQRSTGYSFVVRATNAVGQSNPSATVASPGGSSANITAPGAPTGVTAVDPATAATRYDQGVEVRWTAPASDGNTPIVTYDVAAFRVYRNDSTLVQTREPTSVGSCRTTSFRNQPAATSCVVPALPPLNLAAGAGPISNPTAVPPVSTSWLGYVFIVTATSATSNEGLPTTPVPAARIVGTAASAATSPPVQTVTGAGTVPYVAPPAPVWPTAPAYVPDPILSVNLAGAATGSTVNVAGYVAVPQGRVLLRNPGGESLSLTGGIVAGSFDVDAATIEKLSEPASSMSVGFENVVLQRTIEIVTRVPGDSTTSTMRMQINANGADMAVSSWVIQ